MSDLMQGFIRLLITIQDPMRLIASIVCILSAIIVALKAAWNAQQGQFNIVNLLITLVCIAFAWVIAWNAAVIICSMAGDMGYSAGCP